MICETCHGRGMIRLAFYRITVPCPNGCIGGIAHCCDGDRAQPDPAPEQPRPEREQQR